MILNAKVSLTHHEALILCSALKTAILKRLSEGRHVESERDKMKLLKDISDAFGLGMFNGEDYL